MNTNRGRGNSANYGIKLERNWEDSMTKNFLVVQWLGLCATTVEGMSSIPVRELRPQSCVAQTKRETNEN